MQQQPPFFAKQKVQATTTSNIPYTPYLFDQGTATTTTPLYAPGDLLDDISFETLNGVDDTTVHAYNQQQQMIQTISNSLFSCAQCHNNFVLSALLKQECPICNQTKNQRTYHCVKHGDMKRELLKSVRKCPVANCGEPLRVQCPQCERYFASTNFSRHLKTCKSGSAGMGEPPAKRPRLDTTSPFQMNSGIVGNFNSILAPTMMMADDFGISFTTDVAPAATAPIVVGSPTLSAATVISPQTISSSVSSTTTTTTTPIMSPNVQSPAAVAPVVAAQPATLQSIVNMQKPPLVSPTTSDKDSPVVEVPAPVPASREKLVATCLYADYAYNNIPSNCNFLVAGFKGDLKHKSIVARFYSSDKSAYGTEDFPAVAKFHAGNCVFVVQMFRQKSNSASGTIIFYGDGAVPLTHAIPFSFCPLPQQQV